ncbi:MAG: protein kinase [Alphaproteobacteria bacterium]|nr:protein kinase [Alphaproteobacteria bacterium]
MSEPEVELPLLPERYRALRHIGDGATAEVFLALDTVLDVKVAFKVVRKNLATHRRFRSRFFREIALSAQVVHEHLVPVHDFGELDDGRPFVGLAYAEQGNLRTMLRAGFRITHLLENLEQVCLGLAALHARGLVHQDLKPANILLHGESGARPRVWVADLGVAEDLGQIARDVRRVGGTPTYMAPEQLQGKPQEFGPWTDLYALGLMLFEALAGKRPHQGNSRRVLLEARLQEPPELEPANGVPLPEELKALVQNLMDPEPRQRYDRAADVRRALATIRERMVQQASGAVDSPDEDTGMTDIIMIDPVSRGLLNSYYRGRRPELAWHKVPPEPLPRTPPPEPGRGATARGSLALFALREVPLVARDHVQRIIWNEARRAVSHRAPRILLVIGHQGSGKTRLVESIARALDEGGWMEVVRLRYQRPTGVDDGYLGAVRELLAPWNDTRQRFQERLGRWLARDRETTITDVADEARMLARWCGYLMPGERPPNAALGLSYLYQYLEVRAWRGGSCLVMDDVDNAEEAGDGLAIAESLLNMAVGRRPVLVLCTLSQESLDADPALLARIKALQESGAMRIDLPPLNPDQIHNLLDEALALDEALTRVVARRVEAFPLHAGMLLRQAAARGVLEPGEGMQYRLKAGMMIADVLPVNLDTLYVRRLQSAVDGTLDPAAAAEALAAVALAGQTPPVGVIREISDLGLDELLATGLLREDAGLLRFEHGALQNTARRLAEELADSIELHERLAEAWRNHGEATGVDVDQPLGLHLLRSGRPNKAVGPLLKAVRTFLAQGRYPAAARAADLAITAADLTATDSNPALSTRMEARRLKGVAMLELNQAEEAESLAREGLELGQGERLTRARLRVVLARASIERSSPEQARRLLERAQQAFTALSDREGLAEVAACRAMIARSDNRLVDVDQHYRRVLDLRPVDHPLAVQALSALVSVALDRGRSDDARPFLEALERSARLTGDTRTVAQARFAAGMMAMSEDRMADAEDRFREALASAATSGDHRMQLHCRNSLGEVARFRGERDVAERRYQTYTRLAHTWGYPLHQGVGHINLALLALEEEEFFRSDMEARRAGEALALQPRNWVWLYVALIRAACAAQAGQHSQTSQWWKLAVERGLEHVASRDLWRPLSLVAGGAAENGWAELEEQVWAALARLPSE